MRSRPAAIFMLAALLTARNHAARAEADQPSIALFVSKDVSITDSLAVQKILKDHEIPYHAVRLKVRTEKTAIYAQEPDGDVAYFLRKWLGDKVPIKPFDWETDFEAVIYLAVDYRPPESVRREVEKERSSAPSALRRRTARRAPGRTVPALAPARTQRPWQALRLAEEPDALSWQDVLRRLERLEAQAEPRLGSVVLLMGFPIHEVVRYAGMPSGWLKVHGQPPAIDDLEIRPAVRRVVRKKRPAPPPGPALSVRERLRLAALGSVLTPFGKTGQTFGQMLGLTLQGGYVWHEPWIVMGSLGLFSGSAEIRRAAEQPQHGELTRIPVSIALTYPFKAGSKIRPFVGVGPAVEFQSLSNSGVFETAESRSASAFAFGYEVRVGAQIGMFQRYSLATELAWHAAEGRLAGSREGTGIRFSAGLGY